MSFGQPAPRILVVESNPGAADIMPRKLHAVRALPKPEGMEWLAGVAVTAFFKA